MKIDNYMARSRFWTPLSPGGRTDPSNYWFTGKPHTQTSTCHFSHIIHFSTNLLSYGRYWKRVVTVPYVHSFTEKIQRIFTKHRVATVVKPQTTLRQVLVHPKDKVEKQKKAGVVYKIPCSQCEKVYIGETGRQLGTRITEHRKEAEKISDKNFARSTLRASTNEHYKSAITDHVCQNNHIMNWEASEIVELESDKFKRWIKESICIRSNTPTMNRDEGAYQCSFLPYGHK